MLLLTECYCEFKPLVGGKSEYPDFRISVSPSAWLYSEPQWVGVLAFLSTSLPILFESSNSITCYAVFSRSFCNWVSRYCCYCWNWSSLILLSSLFICSIDTDCSFLAELRIKQVSFSSYAMLFPIGDFTVTCILRSLLLMLTAHGAGLRLEPSYTT